MRSRANVDFTNPADVDRLDRLKKSGENDREALSRIMQNQEAARDKGCIIHAMEQAIPLLEKCGDADDLEQTFGILSPLERNRLDGMLREIEAAGLAPSVTTPTWPALWLAHLSEILPIAERQGKDAAELDNRERLQALNEELGIADTSD